MSNYQHEWVVTYIGGPILMIVAAVIVVCAGVILGHLQYMIATNGSDGLVAAIIGILATILLGTSAAVATFAYGLYSIITGRKTLAGDHWRAEDFR